MSEIVNPGITPQNGALLICNTSRTYACRGAGIDPIYYVDKGYGAGFYAGEKVESLGRYWLKMYSLWAGYPFVYVAADEVTTTNQDYGVTKSDALNTVNAMIDYDMAIMSQLIVAGQYVEVLRNAGNSVSSFENRIKSLYSRLASRHQKLQKMPNVTCESGYNEVLGEYAQPLYKIIYGTNVGIVIPAVAAMIGLVVQVGIFYGATLAANAIVKYCIVPDAKQANEDYKISSNLVKELEQYVPPQNIPDVVAKIEAEAKKHGIESYKKGYRKGTTGAIGNLLKYGVYIVGGGLVIKWIMENQNKFK